MIRQHAKKRFEGLEWKSGYFYTFKYKGWENDPKPHIIFMYAYSGFHPNTGREWRFLIDEELLYCMKSKNISVKYENQGNEIEYNPRWAKGGGRINKGC